MAGIPRYQHGLLRILEYVFQAIVGLIVTALFSCLAPPLKKQFLPLLFTDINISIWVILLFILFFFITLLSLIHLTLNSQAKQQLIPNQPKKSAINKQPKIEPWQKYTQDEFLGFIWHWKYFNSQIASYVITCPKCMGTVIETGFTLQCQTCGKSEITPAKRDFDIRSWLATQVSQNIRIKGIGAPELNIT